MNWICFMQIACLLDCVNVLPVDRIVQYVTSLQQSDGSFTGDKWGEVDTRFSFCAVACLSLLVFINYFAFTRLHLCDSFIPTCKHKDNKYKATSYYFIL